MRSFLSVTAIVCMLLGFAAPAVAAPVTVPAGTQLKVRLINPVSSGTATVGEHFPFQVAEPVTVGNQVVIAAGSSGVGRVVQVSKAQGKSAGAITLEFTRVHAVDGSLIALTQIGKKRAGNAEKGKASTATIAATIALGPLGLFAHNMVKGKDVTVSPKQTFPAWVKTNSVVAVQ